MAIGIIGDIATRQHYSNKMTSVTRRVWLRSIPLLLAATIMMLVAGAPDRVIAASGSLNLSGGKVQSASRFDARANRCLYFPNCLIDLDIYSPRVVIGEQVELARCVDTSARVELQVKRGSSWRTVTYGNSTRSAEYCPSHRPFDARVNLKITSSTATLGVLKWRLVADGRIMGEWAGAAYRSRAEAAKQDSLDAQVRDVRGFVENYANSVVTVSCADSQGSGVSIGFLPSGFVDAEARGFRSMVITNQHVIFPCLQLEGESMVTVLHRGVEYLGYVESYPSRNNVREGLYPDLAAILTTAEIPQSGIRMTSMPQLGNAVVAVGSAGGVPNVATRGEIAGVTEKVIVTTAPAGHGSSGGALFNRRGQLLGFITAANAALVEVTPVTELCRWVLSCDPPVTYK